MVMEMIVIRIIVHQRRRKKWLLSQCLINVYYLYLAFEGIVHIVAQNLARSAVYRSDICYPAEDLADPAGEAGQSLLRKIQSIP